MSYLRDLAHEVELRDLSHHLPALTSGASLIYQFTDFAHIHTSSHLINQNNALFVSTSQVDRTTIVQPRSYLSPTFQHCQSAPPRIRDPQLSHAIAAMSADFWAGYVSGAVGIIIGNPLDLVKTRLQAGPAQDVSTGSTTGAGPRTFKGQFENAGTLVRGKSSLSYHLLSCREQRLTSLLEKCRRDSTNPRLRRT